MLKYINRSEAFNKICEYSEAAYRLATDDMENSPDLLNEVIFSDVFAVDTDDIAEALYSCNALDIVRCGECKHHHWEQEPCHGKTVHYCELPHMRGVEVFKEFFCYYGKRREVSE